jgi:HD-like signal output (HDOD) protein/prolyl-tRNA editing enzyme YbaK/EbsC (Cys-tRNA(Pro) deacylase)
MNIPVVVRDYLNRKEAQFKTLHAAQGLPLADAVKAARVPAQKLLRSVVLKDGDHHLMVVYPATHRLNLNLLNGERYQFRACSPTEARVLLAHCEPTALPPLGEPYGLKVLVDKSVDALDEVYFTPGVTHVFMRMERDDFVRLTARALRGYRIATPISRPAATPAEARRQQMKTKVEETRKLPAMPGIAVELLQLRSNPYLNACEVAAVIEQDPSLTAQLLRYAASPFYAYQGKLDSVETAIVRVLGMDFVMDFAFGLSLGKSFRNPVDGPLGLETFWRDALHVAALTQTLAESMDFSRRPASGTAYMAGLLHNFGLLLLGHLFPQQLIRLNQMLIEQPERDRMELEQSVLGTTHPEMGLWLMDAWNMPREIVETVRRHHAIGQGDYAVYPNLVLLANRLLKRVAIGEANTTEIPPPLLAAVGLTLAQAEAALDSVLQMQDGLHFIARKMVA